MKLKTARITNYKSIEDSEEFSVGSLTCLAGKNESGKTAILQALRRLNPVEPSEATYNHTMEFPRSRLHEVSSSDQRVLDTTWELSDDDAAAVEAALGPGALADRTIRITKGYGSSSLVWAIPLDEEQVIAGVVAQGDELTATAADRVAKHKSAQGLRDMLSRQGDRSTAGEKQLVALLDAFRDRSPNERAIEALSPFLPRLLYFPTYESMPGRVDVEDLIRRKDAGEELTQKDRIFLALLSLANMSVEEVRDQELSESLIAKLEGVSNFISREIFTYWSQNRHLKVRFDYREALPDDPEDGHVFLTRVENTRHGVSVGFDERSAGFVWFFSFLVWFAQAEKEYGDKLVILLDEPGLSLHGRAQADLLRYIKERLLPKYQVVYTTHSPFMVDLADLRTVRTVEDVVKDGEVLGTKVGDKVLSSDPDTILPLRAVLGYDLTQSLFAGAHTLLVELPSDLLYLRWASNELRANDRTTLDSRWAISPTGGVGKVANFVALFGDSDRRVAILSSSHMATFTGGTEADIEDLLGREFYLGLVNATFTLEQNDQLVSSKPATASNLVVQEVERHMANMSAPALQFDRYAPAAYLIENWHDLKEKLGGVDEALDKFEAFFKQVNSVL